MQGTQNFSSKISDSQVIGTSFQKSNQLQKLLSKDKKSSALNQYASILLP